MADPVVLDGAEAIRYRERTDGSRAVTRGGRDRQKSGLARFQEPRRVAG